MGREKAEKAGESRDKLYHRVFGIPEKVSAKTPCLELNGDRELIVEGYRRLLRYNADVISLLLSDGKYLHIQGSALSLREAAWNVLAVTGEVCCISFARSAVCGRDDREDEKHREGGEETYV